MKRWLFLLIFATSFFAAAQTYEDRWTGHFSYVSVKDISFGNNKAYVAAENAVFIYDFQTEAIRTLSTIQGLSGEFISAVHYSENHGVLVVGYQNGLINIVRDGKERILKVVDIVEKQTIPPDRKTINNFHESNGKLYIATQYGISVYDLERLEFGDSYFIGDSGSQINIVQTTVLDSYIFAASEHDGIFRANVNDDDLIDFDSWTVIVNGSFKAMEKLGDQLYAATSSNTVLEISPQGSTRTVRTFSSPVQSFRLFEEQLTISSENGAYVYSPGFVAEAEITRLVDYDLNLLSGNTYQNRVFLGSAEDGLLIVPFGSEQAKQILPSGPIRNRPFALDASPGQLWVVFGETDIHYNPFPLSRHGISRLKDSVWNNISYQELQTAVNAEPTDLMKVTVNPKNPEEAYMSSFQKGLLKVVEGRPVILYDETNSPLDRITVSGGDAGIRIYGSEFDSQGNLWFVQSRTDKGLIRLSPEGQFKKTDISRILNAGSEVALTKLVVSRENYIFFGTYGSGLIGYNPSSGNFNRVGSNSGSGNLPSPSVRALALDAQNRLWIGTLRGLRILYSPGSMFEPGTSPESQPIIIMEDGVPQELLFQQSITAITVDGSNNKWIATASSGVFYLSSDGQKTLLRFTKDNSPLPTNNVQDIAVDPFTGVVYFATTQGLVAYKGSATAPSNTLANLRAYPNPVRPGYEGEVTIDGLTAKANVKITDIEGNLVYEAVSEGGAIQWDTRAFGKYKVRSGVYLVMVTADDDSETKISKIMIVR